MCRMRPQRNARLLAHHLESLVGGVTDVRAGVTSALTWLEALKLAQVCVGGGGARAAAVAMRARVLVGPLVRLWWPALPPEA